jgi:hypothetical protein
VADTGTSTCGTNGEGGFSLSQAEAVAAALNELLPAPGMVRIDVSEDQARLLSALLKSGLNQDVLHDQGVDIASKEIASLVSALKEAVEIAGLDEGASPSP